MPHSLFDITFVEIYTNNLAKPIHSYRPYWAKRFGTAKMLPMSRAEMDVLGWDSCAMPKLG